MTVIQRKNGKDTDPLIPIKLPHDGPLFAAITNISPITNTNTCDGLKEALDLIRQCTTPIANADDDETTTTSNNSTHHPFVVITIKVLRSILVNDNNSTETTNTTIETIKQEKQTQQPIKTMTIREQLSHLRAYRSTLLNSRSSKKNTDGDGDDKEGGGDAQIDQDTTSVLIGMYRILLEWSLSIGTPHALKKASLSCLPVLLQFVSSGGSSSTVAEMVHRSVIRSLFTSSSSSSSTPSIQTTIISSCCDWKNPTQSLFDLLSYPPTRELLVPPPPPTTTTTTTEKRTSTVKEIMSSDNYSIQALQLLLIEGRKVELILQNYYYNDSSSSSSSPKTANQKITTTTTTTDRKHESNHGDDVDVVGMEVMEAVERGIELCATLKLLLLAFLTQLSSSLSSSTTTTIDHDGDATNSPLYKLLSDVIHSLFLPLLRCRATSSDALCICGVTLSQLLLVRWRIALGGGDGGDERIAVELRMFLERCVTTTTNLTVSGDTPPLASSLPSTSSSSSSSTDSSMQQLRKMIASVPPLNVVAILRGIAATMSDSILLQRLKHKNNDSTDVKVSIDNNDGGVVALTSTTHSSLLINPIASYILHQSRYSTENGVRLSSLKGLGTILARCNSILTTNTKPNTTFLKEARELSDEVLHVSLVTWESPPCRQVGSSVPALFHSLIDLMDVLDTTSSTNVNTGGTEEEDAVTKKEDDAVVQTTTTTNSMDILVRQVLAQPPNRKGRYEALEALLPKVGASKLIRLGGVTSPSSYKSSAPPSLSSIAKSTFISTFIDGIGNTSNHSAGAIAELLGKVLSLLRIELHSTAGIDLNDKSRKVGNKKERRKKEQELVRLKQKQKRKRKDEVGNDDNGVMVASGNDVMEQREEEGTEKEDGALEEGEAVRLLPEWIESWSPHIAVALLSQSSSRRNRVASFCLPLIVVMVGGPTYRLDASHAFAALMEEVERQKEKWLEQRLSYCGEGVSDGMGITDYCLWAKLEIVRHASIQKLLKPSLSSSTSTNSPLLQKSIRRGLPLDSAVKVALRHEVPTIRLAAFQVIDTVLCTYDICSNSCIGSKMTTTPMYFIEIEVELWRDYLPYALKCSDKEYLSQLLRCLTSLLNRLSSAQLENEEDDGRKMSTMTTREGGINSTSNKNLLKNFVIDFLLNDIFVKQAAYPGTVLEKERFALSMFKCLISFVSQGGYGNDTTDSRPTYNNNITITAAATNETIQRKKITRAKRKLHPKQQMWLIDITKAMLLDNVILTLVSLLHSMWDASRIFAYELICDLVHYSKGMKKDDVQLPSLLSSDGSRELIYARAIHLASSPRQREADTGARILAILCITLANNEEQFQYVEIFCTLLTDRLRMMKSALGIALGGGANEVDNNGTSPLSSNLPLAHGLIQSLKLMIEYVSFNPRQPDVHKLFERMVATCCRAIEVSLTVVADLKDDTSKEVESSGDEDRSKEDQNQNLGWKDARLEKGCTPLNVNTGAIGANATFASVTSSDSRDEMARFVTQRVVMGSWLLTKEACATLSSVMESFPFTPSFDIMSSSGDLLISTLTSVKHQGAAFAAHKSLYKLCIICRSGSNTNENKIQSLPSTWSRRLLHEISSIEIVRDSTLRRSTGYGLGFLSTLRSEQEGASPRFLFPLILSNIIKLSLPASSFTSRQMRAWKFSSVFDMFSYATRFRDSAAEDVFVQDHAYEWRSRVHALNVLRLIILDSPLATDMRPFIGDAIISALIGYKDTSWAVRNSATMTFAAAMLRVIDADKNAENIDKLAMNGAAINGNAITARELFRSFPPLATCLLCIMKEETSSLSSVNTLHQSLYPLLLLLSRLQAAVFSTVDSGANIILNLFIDPVIKCLGHVHHKVRIMASRALSVLCGGDGEESIRESSRGVLIGKCLNILSFQPEQTPIHYDHNLDHGGLLAIKVLLTTSSDPVRYFDDQLLQAVVYYATCCENRWTSPPPCITVALEVWLHVWNSREKIVKTCSSSHVSLQDTAYEVVHQIEALTHLGKNGDLIGLAGLAAMATKIVCEISTRVIFNTETNTHLRAKHLERIAHLFESVSYDVQLYAVKSFKKKICEFVDDLVNKTVVGIEERKDVLQSVCKMLLGSIVTVMNLHSIGAHPPTIRRMSRCVLEVLYAYRSFPISSCISVSQLSGCSFSSFWDILLQMRVIARGTTEISTLCSENTNGGNILAGNTLELMALLLAELSATSSDITNKIAFFVHCIHSSTDPLSFWRIRYSAAVAIRECGFLSWTPSNDDQENSRLQSCRSRLQLQILKLLQDSDNDVRHAAGRVIMSRDDHPTIALMTMELAYTDICQKVCPKMLPLLINQLVEGCQGVEDQIISSQNEFSFSNNAPPPSSILNLSTKRKIFEEEDPNPFEEELVLVHLGVQLMTKYNNNFDNTTLLHFSSILKRCKAILSDIKRYSNATRGNPDVTHDITWEGHILPKIHGLILGSIVVIYLGQGDDNLGLVQDALSILQVKELWIHPCIIESIKVLSLATEGNEDTRNSIIHCCFLLPGVVLS